MTVAIVITDQHKHHAITYYKQVPGNEELTNLVSDFALTNQIPNDEEILVLAADRVTSFRVKQHVSLEEVK